jgi:hypothetical protein
MSKEKRNLSPRIENRNAWPDSIIESNLDCVIALVGSEV